MRQMRCKLCGGHVVEGRCSECGMYYREDKGIYYLNECRPTHVDAKVNEEPGNRKTPVPNVPRMPKRSKEKNDGDRMAPSESIIRMFDLNKTGTAASARTVPQKTAAGKTAANNTKKTSDEKKKHPWLGIVTLLVVVLPLLFDILEDQGVLDSLSDTVDYYIDQFREAVGKDGDTYADQTFEEAVYGGVTREIPDNGTAETYMLDEGEYLVGCNLPEGVYEITGNHGDYTRIELFDWENDIYQVWYLENYYNPDGSYEVTNQDPPVSVSQNGTITISDIRLYDGAYLNIDSTHAVTLDTENAQELSLAMENPITEEVEIGTEPMTAGVDFEPGYYDLTAVKGEVLISIEDEDGYTTWYTLDADRIYNSNVHRNVWIGADESINFEILDGGQPEARLVPSLYVNE